MRYTEIPAFIFCLLLISGCSAWSRSEYSDPLYLDLAAQNCRLVSDLPAVFKNFSDITGNGMKITRRHSDGKVTFDSSSRFTAPPAQLIRRRMTELFPAASGAEKSFRISGTLSRFEADLKHHCAFMKIDCILEYGFVKTAMRHEIRVKLADLSASSIAEGLESCIIESARRLAAEMAKIKKQSNQQKVKK